jgi:hypothetical protein
VFALIGGPTVPQYRCRSEDAGTITQHGLPSLAPFGICGSQVTHSGACPQSADRETIRPVKLFRPSILSVLAISFAFAAACGSTNNPTAPDSGAPGPSGATITIQSNGTLSPSNVTVTRGQSVTIVNNGTRVYDMTSDPHPTHGDCPAINAVGQLQPGQSKLTNALNTARTCGIHDHISPDDNGLKGRITVQ